MIEIPENDPPYHIRNVIGEFKYTFCTGCQSVFMGYFTECILCHNTNVIRKRIKPYWILSLVHAVLVEHKYSVMLDYIPDEDGDLLTKSYSFPSSSWEYIFVSSNCFGPNDVSWWMK